MFQWEKSFKWCSISSCSPNPTTNSETWIRIFTNFLTHYKIFTTLFSDLLIKFVNKNQTLEFQNCPETPQSVLEWNWIKGHYLSQRLSQGESLYVPHRSKISTNWNPSRWDPIMEFLFLSYLHTKKLKLLSIILDNFLLPWGFPGSLRKNMPNNWQIQPNFLFIFFTFSLFFLYSWLDFT